MQGEQAEPPPACAIFQPQLSSDGGLLRPGPKMTQRINHHVAHQEDAFAWPAFSQKICDGVFFGNEEIVRNRIGQDTIDFFRHGAVKAAQSRLYVSYANAQ